MTKRKLRIKWQRLVSNNETCPRCGSTEKEIEEAVSTLKKSLKPLGADVVLEKEEISLARFKKNPLESNRIWLNNRPLEKYFDASVDQSPCCDVCGPSECRTLEVDGVTYETIPAEIVIKAGLIAVSKLYQKKKSSCCENNNCTC